VTLLREGEHLLREVAPQVLGTRAAGQGCYHRRRLISWLA
jgi:hypothetical protein